MVINVIGTLSASADVLALAAVEVDLSSVAVGSTVTVKWRGKPVFIKHRTDQQIKDVANTNIGELRHPQTDLERVKDPKWCVLCSAWLSPALHLRSMLKRAVAPSTQLADLVSVCRLVILGVCTHLGCVPLPNAGDYNGWYW